MKGQELFDKLFLKSDKVELAIIDDIKKLTDEYSKIGVDAFKRKSKIQSEAKQLAKEIQSGLSALKEAEKKAEVFTSAAKNLGVDVPDIVKKVSDGKNFKLDDFLSWAESVSK